MTPDELHALADALEPMARAPRFEDFDVPGFCAWVRAQADAQPVAWRCEVRGDGSNPARDGFGWRHYHTTTSEREALAFVARCGNGIEGRAVPLYPHPAPAAPQAEPSAALIRAYNSGYMQGHHDTVESCFTDIHQSDMDTFHADLVAELGLSAAPQAEPMADSDADYWLRNRQPILDAIERAGFMLMSNASGFWLHPRGTTDAQAEPIDPHMIVADDRFPDEQAEPKREPFAPDELERIIDDYVADYELSDGEVSRDLSDEDRFMLKDAIIGLLVDPAWDRAWGAHIDELAREQAEPKREPLLGELMREQRQSRIVAGAYPDGNPNAGAMMAQTRQAEPKPTPASGDDLSVYKEMADSYRNDEPTGAPYGIIDPDYGRVYTIARKLAWEEGYAIGLHGSFTRDLDLIAVPWTDTACEPEHLIRRIVDATGLKLRDGVAVKPHGRRAWTLKFPTFGDPRFVDLSVMPRIGGSDAE